LGIWYPKNTLEPLGEWFMIFLGNAKNALQCKTLRGESAMNETENKTLGDAAVPTVRPRQGDVSVLRPEGFRRMAYTEWGDPHVRKVAVCVHGLTRNGRDFDALATALVGAGYRVVCPDVLGRGQSERLIDPSGYGYPQYMGDLTTLLARCRAETVDWIGTSMGGLLGMFLAATPGAPIRRLVINDVGPFISAEALTRIMDYVGKAPSFDSLQQAEAYLRIILAPFGKLSDAEWKHLTAHSTWPDPENAERFVLAYDPAIAKPISETEIKDVDLWPLWGQVKVPVMVVRGVESDLLSAETAARMVAEHPDAQLLEVPDAGHAPMMATEAETSQIINWLGRD
jgi:pimeloyl-ACP methyl ester carboxylesterase